MSFLSSLPENATLADLFKAYPATAKALLPFEEVLMRGPSPLSVAQRELIAAFVSGLNACGHCYGVHTATAQAFGVAEGLFEDLLADVDSAALDDRMKPILRYVRKLTLTPGRMTQADADAVFVAGWDEKALHDAASVCGLFNLMNRMVDGTGLTGDADYFRGVAQGLARDGYTAIIERLDL